MESSKVQITIQVPDEIARVLIDAGDDLPRRALEGLALEELWGGRITEPQLGKMLDLARVELDGFLKTHGIYQDYTMEDFDREREALKEIGL